MIRDVSTRWNSTLQMLDRALALKVYIRHWIDKYPAYRGLLLTEDEWLLLEDVLTILQPFRFYTLWISSSKSVTIHRSLEVYSAIILRLQHRLDELKHARLDWKVELRTAMKKTLEYATRLWDNLDSVHLPLEDRPRYPDSNRSMPVREDTIMDLAAILDPFTKLENFRGWDQEDQQAGVERETSWTESYRQRFLDFWKQHYAPNLKPPQLQRKRRWTSAFHSDSNDESNDEGDSHEVLVTDMQKLVEQYLDGETESIIVTNKDPEELKTLVANKGVLYKTVVRAFYSEPSVLGWWARNSDRKEFYPLVQMARDILAIPAAAVACEAAFSSGRDLCHYRRSKMKPDTITQSMICKHFDRKTMDEDIHEESNEDSNDASVELAQRLRALEVAASQFDVVFNRENADRKRRQLKKARNDLTLHRSLTEGREETPDTIRKSLGQIEHDGEVEYNKTLPPLPQKKYSKVQPLLPRAVGNEEEESVNLEQQRASQILPSVMWDEVSDFSGSDSEEESERREERHRRREKELQNRGEALKKARRMRPVASGRQRKEKQASRRQSTDGHSEQRSPKSPRLTTPTRRRQECSLSPNSVRPRRITALMKEGSYKV
jgi:hypothetical protein